MKRVLSLAFVVALIVPFIAQAQAKPDFSGSWTLDPAKSDPASSAVAAAAVAVADVVQRARSSSSRRRLTSRSA